MKILMAAVVLAASAGVAWAACPPGTSYQCFQGMNGKVVCGCR